MSWKCVFHMILLYGEYIDVNFKWLIKTKTVTLISGVLSKYPGAYDLNLF